MVRAYDVHGTDLVKGLAEELKKNPALKQPEWVEWVKTGRHRERAPTDREWYYTRMASILRRVYVDGPVGTESLRSYYGGRKARGVRKHKVFKASGKVVRNCLQALEKEGFIKKEKTGRAITAKGASLLSKKSKELFEKMKAEKSKKAERKAVPQKPVPEKKFEEAKKKSEAKAEPVPSKIRHTETAGRRGLPPDETGKKEKVEGHGRGGIKEEKTGRAEAKDAGKPAAAKPAASG